MATLLVAAIKKSGGGTSRRPYFEISIQDQANLAQAIAEILQQAQGLGKQHGQAMLGQKRESGVLDSIRGFMSSARSIVSGLIDRLRTLIQQAIKNADEGANLEQIVQDVIDQAAETIPEMTSESEVHREVEQGVLDALNDGGIGQVVWVASPGACEQCLAVAMQGPRSIDEEWESGVTAPPLHPRCRCNVQPVERES